MCGVFWPKLNGIRIRSQIQQLFILNGLLRKQRREKTIGPLPRHILTAGILKKEKVDHLKLSPIILKPYTGKPNQIQRTFFNAFTLTRNIAAIQRTYFNYEQALVYYDSALGFLQKHILEHPRIAREYDDHSLVFDTRYYKASTLREQGKLEESMEAFFGLAEETGSSTTLRLKSLINLGLIARDIKDFQQANQFFEEVLTENSKKDPILEWRARHGLGLMALLQGQHKQAVSLYLDALKVAERIESPREFVFSTYLDLGQSYFALGEYQKAVDNFQLALASWESPRVELEPEFYDIFQLMGRAIVYLDPGRAEEAIVKYTSLSNKFIDTQRDLRNEQARRTLLLAANQHQAKIKQREELQSIRSNHNVERWVTFGGVVLFIFIAYQAFRYFQKKRMWRRAMEVTKNRNPTLSE